MTYSPESIYRYTVLQAATNTVGGGVQWASGPLYSEKGGFQNGVSETLEIVNAYLNPVSWTVKNTRPSKAYPTADMATVGGIDCFVATESPDGAYTYLHVLNPDADAVSGRTLTLPPAENGKIFSGAKLAIDGTPLALESNGAGYSLTLPEGITFNGVDTVITLY